MYTEVLGLTMADRIKRQRKVHGINQEELSDRLGLSIQTIRRWEWGKRAPNTDIMPKLAEALGTSVAYLMGLENEPTSAGSSSEIPNSLPAPVEQSSHETRQEKITATVRLIYEWGKDNRLDLPDTPENREMLAGFLAKQATAGEDEGK